MSEPTTQTSVVRRIPLVPIALSILVLASGALATVPIRDAVTGNSVGDARLERGFGYAVLGPISGIFDAMTLFTVGQIIGFTLWLIGLYVVARIIARRGGGVSIGRELLYTVAALVGLVLFYGAVVILPRPMAQLVMTRTDAIAVDFHSHTMASHDGRAGWTAADLRDWHADAGFDVAYVTDHASFDGVTDALQLDSALAGQGTTLLPGLEVFLRGEHVNILNAGLRYKGLTTADFKDVDEQALVFTSVIPGAEPVLIETIPGNLDHVSPAAGPRTAGVRAIEIIDGSPRGMSQTRRDHARIIALADARNLALVAGTDNHGWGRASPGWTLVRVTEWRGYAPDSLANRIESAIRAGGRSATRVIERTTAGSSPAALAFTLPVVVWTTLRTASSPERISWFVWIWGLTGIMWWVRRRR